MIRTIVKAACVLILAAMMYGHGKRVGEALEWRRLMTYQPHGKPRTYVPMMPQWIWGIAIVAAFEVIYFIN